MTDRFAKLVPLTSLLSLLLCAHCAGNNADGGGSTLGAGGSQSMNQGSNGGPTDTNTSSTGNPNANDTNTMTGTDPNTAQSPNTTTTPPTTASCTSMPGPCSTSLQAIALTGCSSADYMAKVTVGGSQTFELLVDSGSTTMAVVSADCSDCQGVTPTYTVDASAQDLGTPVKSQYGSNNGWNGTAVSDTVALATNLPSVTMRFARITQQTTNSAGVGFFAGSDCGGGVTQNGHQGILGLGNAANAIQGTDTYLDILKATGKLGDAFAFEACDSGGRMWLGGYDPSSVSATPVFTPMDTSKGFDEVTLNGITVGSTSTGLSSGDFIQTVVDTGTSIFVLPAAAFDALTSTIEADPNYSASMPKGFLSSSEFVPATGTQAQLDALFPAMHLSFPGVNGGSDITVDLPASESYLTPFTYNGQAGYLSGLVSGSTNASVASVTILGNSTMHSHVLIFDRANQQLGYGPHTSCPAP